MSAHPPFDGDEPDDDEVLSLLYNLVYCSRVAEGVDASEVDRIIATSRRNNAAHGITGLLVFGSGIFFQWLEGPRESVTELMARIEKDPRHRAVVVLDSDEEVRERVFGEWDMELVSAEDLRNVLVDALANAKQPGSAQSLREMLALLDAGEIGGIGKT
jgi:hypothetical protein